MVRKLFFRRTFVLVVIPCSVALLLTGCSESYEGSSFEPSVESNDAAATQAPEADDGPQLDSPLTEPDDSGSDATSTETASLNSEDVPQEQADTTSESTSSSATRAE